MGFQKFRYPLQEHAYLLYPLITIISVIIIGTRVTSLSHTHHSHRFPSPWKTVVSFGDDLSDSGNGAHITGGKYPSEPWHWHHRFSNGPNWVDNLINDLGGLGKVKMRNFAHGGATSDNSFLAGSLLGHYIPGIHQQVRGFMLKSRQSGYPNKDNTLYTIWAGSNDCLSMANIGSFKTERNFTIADIEESVYQNIIQMERDSKNKIRYVLVLTPPPVEDMPIMSSEVARNNNNHHETASGESFPHLQAAHELAANLPYALYNKFSNIGRATIINNMQIGPEHPSHILPNHRIRSPTPITHFISVDLPENYDHLIPHEHGGGTHTTFPQQDPVAGAIGQAINGPENVARVPVDWSGREGERLQEERDINQNNKDGRQPLFGHSKYHLPDGLHRPLLRLHKREMNTSPKDEPRHDMRGDTSERHHGSNKLHIMVYDSYHFIKHAEQHPACFNFSPKNVNQTCNDLQSCYDRVWFDDTNLNTAVHYWMAKDINTRLHMWYMYINGINMNSIMKNSTKSREIELELLGYTCPMHSAPVHF